MTKEARMYNGEEIVSSISGAGKVGQLDSYMQNNEITFFKAVYKNKLKITKGLNVRRGAIKLQRKM